MNESYTSFAQVYDMFMDNVTIVPGQISDQLLKEYQWKTDWCSVLAAERET